MKAELKITTDECDILKGSLSVEINSKNVHLIKILLSDLDVGKKEPP